MVAEERVAAVAMVAVPAKEGAPEREAGPASEEEGAKVGELRMAAA